MFREMKQMAKPTGTSSGKALFVNLLNLWKKLWADVLHSTASIS